MNPKKMKIAVIGAGFAGLGFSWHALELSENLSLTLYDPKPIEQRASSNAFLLHPFIHFKSKLNWKGREAFEEASQLLNKVTCFSKEPFFLQRPFIKLANHPSQLEPFQEAAACHPDLTWLTNTSYGHPALRVEKAYQMRSDLYLEALQRACIERGANWIQKSFSEEEASLYDRVVYASGDRSLDLLPSLKGSKVKGQLFKSKWPKGLVLPTAMTAYKCHFVPSFDQKTLVIGSTFERKFSKEEPDLIEAFELLRPHIEFLLPRLKVSDLFSVSGGIRLNASDRLPLCGPLDEKRWLFSALGSKGMLYHSYLGKKLARSLLNQEDALPHEVRIERSIRSH